MVNYRNSHPIVFFCSNGLQYGGCNLGAVAKPCIKSLYAFYFLIGAVCIKHFGIAYNIIGNDDGTRPSQF